MHAQIQALKGKKNILMLYMVSTVLSFPSYIFVIVPGFAMHNSHIEEIKYLLLIHFYYSYLSNCLFFSGPASDKVTGLIHKYFSEGHTFEVILDFLEKKAQHFSGSENLKEEAKESRTN